MNKENNRSAAGLRQSAIAERVRLREEWSALKGTDPKATMARNKETKFLTKKQSNVVENTATRQPCASARCRGNDHKKPPNMQVTSEALRGVVALVETGSELRALPLRAALSALGASVLPAWSPLVTHLVWAHGGSRAIRAKARALACRLVSPLWVEACAAGERRLPEQAFPAAARASDLPSPRTLRQLLKKAEMENIPIIDLLTDSKEDDKDPKVPRLRISSETERDTSTDTSHDTSADATGVEARVNTAPRRALPTSTCMSPQPQRPSKSRRQLFTQKEVIRTGSDSDSGDDAPAVPESVKQNKLTQRDRKDLARAERMARRLLKATTDAGSTQATNVTHPTFRPNIVLTGMSRAERRGARAALRPLGARVRRRVGLRTTHVLLGSCRTHRDAGGAETFDVTGITQDGSGRGGAQKARTLSALAGAARGCRVLAAQWAARCAAAGAWLHPCGYEVPHLKKISQKARVERTALGKQHSDYAYDVFAGTRVYVAPDTEQRDAAVHLLALCGAALCGAAPCGPAPCGAAPCGPAPCGAAPCDVELGARAGAVHSKWVFDSVAAGRVRSTRRYVVCSAPGLISAAATQRAAL